MSPVFTSLGVWLLCNQRFDRRFLAGMALAILGAIALEGNNLLVDRHRAMGDLAALLAALLYAANLLTIESLRSKLRLLPSWGCGHAFVGSDPPFGCPSASAQGPRSGGIRPLGGPQNDQLTHDHTRSNFNGRQLIVLS